MSDFVDITEDFVKASQSLKEGELIHSKFFSFYNAMCSNEIGDPKVDEDAKIISVLSPRQRDEANLIKYNLTIKNLFYLFNEIKKCEATYLDAYPYPQTIPTVIYTQPCILDKVFCFSFLNETSEIKEEGTLNSEEFNHFLLGCLYLYIIYSFKTIYQYNKLLDSCTDIIQEEDIIYSANLNDDIAIQIPENEKLLSYYLKYDKQLTLIKEEKVKIETLDSLEHLNLVETYLKTQKFYSEIVESMILLNSKNNNHLLKQLNKIAVDISKIKETISLVEEIPDSVDPDLCLFVKYSFAKMTIPNKTYEEANNEWYNMIQHYIKCVNIIENKNCPTNSLCHFQFNMRQFYLNNHHICVRVLMMKLYENNISQHLKKYLSETLMIPAEFYAYFNDTENLGIDLFDEFVKIFDDLIRCYCLLPPRRNSQMAQYICNIQNFLQNYTAWFDINTDEKTKTCPNYELYKSIFYTYVSSILCECCKDYLEEIIELKLNHISETYVIYWYIDYVVSRLVDYDQKIITFRKVIKQREYEAQRKYNKKKKSKNNNNNNMLENITDVFIDFYSMKMSYFQIIRFTYHGIFQALLGLRIKGLIPEFVTTYGNEKLRYNSRFQCFDNLNDPALVSYDCFSDMISPDKVQFESIVKVSMKTINDTKSILKQLIEKENINEDMKKDLLNISKILAANSISIMKYTSTNYEAKEVVLDYSFSKFFTVIRFK